ncbi:MAG: diguanylate cyclase [Deltaproteobacteria bacterium]|nr:diguanylate cyclase [Deltaproteobacteria bacterium]
MEAGMKTEGEFNKLLAVSVDAIVSMDERDRIILWNPAAERMFGYSKAEASGMTVSELMPEVHRKGHIEGIRRFLKTEKPTLIGRTVEVEAKRKDGTVFPVELSLAAEKKEGSWTFFSIIRDITERKKGEAEIAAKNALLNKANSELRLLLDVSMAISHTIDMDALLKNILETITTLDLFKVERKGGIFIVDGDKMRLRSYVGHTADFVALHDGMKVGDCLCGLAARTGEIIISGDSDEDLRHTIKSDIAAHGHIILPLKSDGEVLGVLCLYTPTGAVVDEMQKSMLAAIGSLLGVAINNSRLYEKTRELSLCDPLTGLANRRLMYIELERNIAKVRRYGGPFSLIMIDIDNFKEYNDTHGHLAGDALLAEFSALLTVSTREMDMRARYGGEEFLVLLPDTDIKTAQVVAERIRRAAEQKGDVTVSLGVAAYDTGIKQGVEIVNKADDALYRAKCNGRNRVETGT